MREERRWRPLKTLSYLPATGLHNRHLKLDHFRFLTLVNCNTKKKWDSKLTSHGGQRKWIPDHSRADNRAENWTDCGKPDVFAVLAKRTLEQGSGGWHESFKSSLVKHLRLELCELSASNELENLEHVLVSMPKLFLPLLLQRTSLNLKCTHYQRRVALCSSRTDAIRTSHHCWGAWGSFRYNFSWTAGRHRTSCHSTWRPILSSRYRRSWCLNPCRNLLRSPWPQKASEWGVPRAASHRRL